MAGKVKILAHHMGGVLIEAFKGLDVDFKARCIQRGLGLEAVGTDGRTFKGKGDKHGFVIALCEEAGVDVKFEAARDARNARYESLVNGCNTGDRKAAEVQGLALARQIFNDAAWVPSEETVTYTFPEEREY